jgi:uncharacterized protein YjbJ (UPF0337 family)
MSASGRLFDQFGYSIAAAVSAFCYSPEPSHAEVSWPANVVTGEMAMDENRVAGTVRSVAGKAEEGFGRVTGDSKTRAEGLVNQAAGAAQDLYGQARDSTADAAGAAKDAAATLERWLRTTIETQPYTAAIIAVGIGWLFGRMHRPL